MNTGISRTLFFVIALDVNRRGGRKRKKTNKKIKTLFPKLKREKWQDFNFFFFNFLQGLSCGIGKCCLLSLE